MKKAILPVLILVFLLSAGTPLFPCFSVIVGRNASADNAVLIAHNEDDPGNPIVNVYKIPAETHKKHETVLLNPTLTIPQARLTAAFLWLELPELDFSDSFMNEHGVVVTSDSCPSREDKPELVNGGIGWGLRRVLAERARSAREAVKLAGELIEQYGYNGSGRTYVIADAAEGWFLAVVKGKHWVARRVPDNEVAVIANYYRIGRVDLKDSKNYMGSPDIVEYAVKRGWYSPEKEGEFDFARAYSDPGNYRAEGNVLRQWRGTNLLSKRQYKPDEAFPFSFEPRRKVRPEDIMQLLRDHYEGTEYDLSENHKKGSPNSTRKRAICTETTQYSFVAHLRTQLPAEIGHIAWIAFRRPDSNAYSPWYFSTLDAPPEYGRCDRESALGNHYNPQFGDTANHAFLTFAKVSEGVDRNYRENIRAADKVWRNFEEYVQKETRNKEREFLYLLQSNRHVALRIVTNYVHNLEFRKWFMAGELLKELK